MRVYVHGQDPQDLTLYEPAEGTRLHEMLDTDGFFVFIQGDDEPLNPDVLVGSLTENDHVHLHRHRCRKVVATVRYNGQTVTETTSPGRTLEKIFEWAVGKKGFKLEPAAAADLTLRLPGSEADLDLTEGVEVFVTPGTCAATLDLLPAHRFAG